jgi:hypothetical protein
LLTSEGALTFFTNYFIKLDFGEFFNGSDVNHFRNVVAVVNGIKRSDLIHTTKFHYVWLKFEGVIILTMNYDTYTIPEPC